MYFCGKSKFHKFFQVSLSLWPSDPYMAIWRETNYILFVAFAVGCIWSWTPALPTKLWLSCHCMPTLEQEIHGMISKRRRSHTFLGDFTFSATKIAFFCFSTALPTGIFWQLWPSSGWGGLASRDPTKPELRLWCFKKRAVSVATFVRSFGPLGQALRIILICRKQMTTNVSP